MINEKNFIEKWNRIMKSEQVFFSLIRDNDNLENLINSALKGIQYYYYGKPYYALKCINFSLSKLEDTYSIIKSILLYYRISIQCDENNLQISKCTPIYNCFCYFKSMNFFDKYSFELINILFYKKIDLIDTIKWINNKMNYLEDNEDNFKNKTLYNFVKLRMLNLMAELKDNDEKCWKIYINEIENSKFKVDLPYAKFHYIKVCLQKGEGETEQFENEKKELKNLTVETKNSQVELKICKAFTNNENRIKKIKEINEIENQIYGKGLLFNTLNDCFDILWGVDSIDLYHKFLNFIIELDNKVLYLFNGNLIPEYVDHGIGHAVSMLTNLKKIQTTLCQSGMDFLDFFGIDKSDYVKLIIAIIYHDIGMSGNNNIKAASGGINVRNNHSLFSWDIIRNILPNEYAEWDGDDSSVNEIALIASLHTADFDSKQKMFNFQSQEGIKFPENYKEQYKDFFFSLTDAKLDKVNKLIAILQLMDGIDFNNKRIGIAKKDAIIPKRLECYKKLSKKCSNEEVKKYFDNQVSCIGNWYKHYQLHKYTVKTKFLIHENSTLKVQVELDNDYTDERFIREDTHVKTFTSLIDFFKTKKINIQIFIYNNNFNIKYPK